MKNEATNKVIFHIDMNAFFCTVAEIKDPSLRGKAFAIGRKESLKGVISTASYEARKYGIHSAMPLKEAYRLLPSLLVIDGDYKEYSKYHKLFVKMIKEYTSLIEVASIDELYADMTEVVKSIHPVVLAKLIQYRLLKELNLKASIGIGSTLFYAKMASDMKKPLGLTIITKKNYKDLLYPLSVADIFGIGKKTFPKLIDAGIKTIKDFMDLENKDKIISIVGENTYLYGVSHIEGNSSNIVDPNRYGDSQSISTMVTFDIYKTTKTEVLYEARLELKDIYKRLIKEEYVAKSVILTLRDDLFNTISRRKTLKEYSNDFDIFNTLLEDLVEEYFKEGKNYRLIGVGFSNMIKKSELKEEQNLFNFDNKKEKIEEIMKEINSKYSDKLIWVKERKDK